MARLVGPAEVGIGAAAIAVHVLLWVAVNALFADALVQRSLVEEATFSSAFTASVAAGCAAALFQAALGYPLAASLGDQRLSATGHRERLVATPPLDLALRDLRK